MLLISQNNWDIYILSSLIVFFLLFIISQSLNLSNIKTELKSNQNKNIKAVNSDQLKIKKDDKKKNPEINKNKEDDEYEMTKEQEQELWAETYYTKPKKVTKKVDAPQEETYTDKLNKKLIKIFKWFVFLNIIALITYAIINCFSFTPYGVILKHTTKEYDGTPEYKEAIEMILSHNLDDFFVSDLGKRFLESIKSMIDTDSLTTMDINIFLQQWSIKDESIVSKYKILFCMMEYFIDHYKESSIEDRGNIRLIIKLCYMYCTELQLLYSQIDLIRLLRFIYQKINSKE